MYEFNEHDINAICLGIAIQLQSLPTNDNHTQLKYLHEAYHKLTSNNPILHEQAAARVIKHNTFVRDAMQLISSNMQLSVYDGVSVEATNVLDVLFKKDTVVA